MKTYKVSDILNPREISGNSEIINFVNACKQFERTDKVNSVLRQNASKIFCYEYNYFGVNYISFPIGIIMEVLGLTPKSTLDKAPPKIPRFISAVSGKSITDYRFFEANNFKFGKGDIRLKQEFVCLAVAYFFRNKTKTIYNFHEYVKHLSRLVGDARLSYSLDEFKKFSTVLNYKYIIDAVGVAKTLIANADKLKLRNLSSYTVVEESHDLAKDLKDKPFNKINKPSGYFDKPDKLMIADMFLIDTSSQNYYKKNLIVFNQNNLEHDVYRKFMDASFREGVIVPISLKQLTSSVLTNNFTTSRIKIVGSYNIQEDNKKDFVDEYMEAVIELFSQSNMRNFVDAMKKALTIKISKTRFKTSKKNTELDFETNFNLKNKKNYTIWMSGGSIYIKPSGTTSPSGLGGIASNYLVEEIIEKLPRNDAFFRNLNKARMEAFGDDYNKLFDPREIITLDTMNKFLQTKTPNQQVMYLSNYAKALKKNMAQNAPRLNLTGFRSLKKDEIAQKMVHFEMMSYLIAHERIVTEWIKKSFIMSMYGIASGTGKIIFDGKNIKQGDFGRGGVKKHAILNPMYLKIGY